MNKIEVAAGGIGRQASASTGALQGITFEDFAEEYFAMMLNKQNEDIDDDPSIKGVEVRFENLSLTVNVGGKEVRSCKARQFSIVRSNSCCARLEDDCPEQYQRDHQGEDDGGAHGR